MAGGNSEVLSTLALFVHSALILKLFGGKNAVCCHVGCTLLYTCSRAFVKCTILSLQHASCAILYTFDDCVYLICGLSG